MWISPERNEPIARTTGVFRGLGQLFIGTTEPQFASRILVNSLTSIRRVISLWVEMLRDPNRSPGNIEQ